MKRLMLKSIALVAFTAVFVKSQDVKTIPPTLLFELLALDGDIETKQRPKYFSPTALAVSPDSSKLYVAEQNSKQVAVIDLAANTVTKTMLMPNEPTGIAVSRDGATLFVTCSSERWPNGFVHFVNASTGAITKSIAVGHSARSPLLNKDGSVLYVCNLYEDNVSVINVATAAEVLPRIGVTREPYAAAITPDGQTLVITNALPDQKATDTTVIACKITLVNTATKTVTAGIPMTLGSHSLFGVTISADGKWAFATHLVGRFNLLANRLEGGWIHTNNLAVIDIPNKKLANDIALDNATRGLANPWGMGITANGKYIAVLHAGTDQMTVIDLPRMIDSVTSTKDTLAQNFTTIRSFKKIIDLNVEPYNIRGPRIMAMVGNKAYVGGYFSDRLCSIDLTAVDFSPGSNIPPMAALSLGTPKPITTERQGEINFNDAGQCFEKWQSCNSCHPFTRPDALNWILNAPQSYPKNAKSMLYSWWTPPESWAQKRLDGRACIRSGIDAELGIQASEEIAVPIDTFLMRLKPVPSPFLVKGKLNSAAQRGKIIFKNNCVDCHPAPLYTNMKMYNAGVPDPFDKNTLWDTPSLNETWRTSPYGHLGSFDTLENIIKLKGHSEGASQLNDADFKDLLEYVKAL